MFPEVKWLCAVNSREQGLSAQYGLWHYSLTDARITNLVDQYERPRSEGKAKLQDLWDALLREYPAEANKEATK
jgi:hypothetical protein